MQKSIIPVLILFMMITIGGCATIGQLVQKPEIAFDSLDTQNISLLEGTLLFRFNVTNPNPIGVDVDDILYDLEINGERFISSKLDKGMRLAASGTSPLEIPVTINYLEFFNSVSRLIKSDALDYSLSGSAGVGPFRIPYRTSGKIDVPKLPDITVESIRFERLSFTGATLKLALGMKNPNDYAVKMDGLEYTARLGDVELAKGTARNVSPLAGDGRSTMDVGVDLNFLELGRNAKALLSKSSGRCRFSGNMLVNTPGGTEKIPFQFDGKVPFIK